MNSKETVIKSNLAKAASNGLSPQGDHDTHLIQCALDLCSLDADPTRRRDDVQAQTNYHLYDCFEIITAVVDATHDTVPR